jgi:hypothetical protein
MSHGGSPAQDNQSPGESPYRIILRRLITARQISGRFTVLFETWASVLEEWPDAVTETVEKLLGERIGST